MSYEVSASKILRTFARQSAPSLRFARGDAGEGCQHVPISTSSPFRASNALFSAYLPTPITRVIPISTTTSRRWSSHAFRSFFTAFPLILSGVMFFPVSPRSNSGQWLTKNTFLWISSGVFQMSLSRPQSLVPLISCRSKSSPSMGRLGCLPSGS